MKQVPIVDVDAAEHIRLGFGVYRKSKALFCQTTFPMCCVCFCSLQRLEEAVDVTTRYTAAFSVGDFSVGQGQHAGSDSPRPTSSLADLLCVQS